MFHEIKRSSLQRRALINLCFVFVCCLLYSAIRHLEFPKNAASTTAIYYLVGVVEISHLSLSWIKSREEEEASSKVVIRVVSSGVPSVVKCNGLFG